MIVVVGVGFVNQHGAGNTAGVEAERLRQCEHGTVDGKADASGAVSQPVPNKLPEFSSGKRRGLLSSEPDPLLGIVPREAAAECRIEGVQTGQVQ